MQSIPPTTADKQTQAQKRRPCLCHLLFSLHPPSVFVTLVEVCSRGNPSYSSYYFGAAVQSCFGMWCEFIIQILLFNESREINGKHLNDYCEVWLRPAASVLADVHSRCGLDLACFRRLWRLPGNCGHDKHIINMIVIHVIVITHKHIDINLLLLMYYYYYYYC